MLGELVSLILGGVDVFVDELVRIHHDFGALVHREVLGFVLLLSKNVIELEIARLNAIAQLLLYVALGAFGQDLF